MNTAGKGQIKDPAHRLKVYWLAAGGDKKLPHPCPASGAPSLAMTIPANKTQGPQQL
jgi:hypothetical protein